MPSPAAKPQTNSIPIPGWFPRSYFPLTLQQSTRQRSDLDSRFLNLPPEVRLAIYCQIFRDSEIWVNPKPRQPGPWPWQRKRRSGNFKSSGQWPILLTCRLCFQEARRLFIEITKFSVERRHITWEPGVALIRFAESISEYSRLHLFEVRDFLARGLQLPLDNAWTTLCVQAIPLFPKIRTCVLYQELWTRGDDPMHHLPGGYMAENEVKGMIRFAKERDKRIAQFMTLVLSDEYRYMRHIDFLFVFHLYRCERRLVGQYSFREEVHKHSIEAVSFINLGQRIGWFDKDRDSTEEDGLDRIRRPGPSIVLSKEI